MVPNLYFLLLIFDIGIMNNIAKNIITERILAVIVIDDKKTKIDSVKTI